MSARKPGVDKLLELKIDISLHGDMLVAFSGGVDSTFLAKVAHDVLGEQAVAVTATSSTYPERELSSAKRIAGKIGIRHIIIEFGETDIAGFCRNMPDRCYHCKRELFSKLWKVAKRENISHVADASNADDLSDYRPGMKAKSELSVISPLVDAGIGKDEIRALSRDMGLEIWDRPSFACLASRFPYGTEINRERLTMVERAEDAHGVALREVYDLAKGVAREKFL